MPVIKKNKKVAKAKNKALKKAQKALVAKAQPKKNTSAYFGCMKACCQAGIKPKKISQIAHECKTNALAINAKLSTQKTQAVKKIKEGYVKLGQGLNEFIKSK